jgi:hypothetical protein
MKEKQIIDAVQLLKLIIEVKKWYRWEVQAYKTAELLQKK